jgi:hypothetical protein
VHLLVDVLITIYLVTVKVKAKLSLVVLVRHLRLQEVEAQPPLCPRR